MFICLRFGYCNFTHSNISVKKGNLSLKLYFNQCRKGWNASVIFERNFCKQKIHISIISDNFLELVWLAKGALEVIFFRSLSHILLKNRKNCYMQTFRNRGSFIKHVDRNFDFLDPAPPLWTILLYNAYVVIWTFGKPPLPPAKSTWFMNAPRVVSNWSGPFFGSKKTLTKSTQTP